MLVNIIMFFTMYPVLLVLYFCFRGQYQYADGCLFAVNMKPEWIREQKVEAIVEKFKKEIKGKKVAVLGLTFKAGTDDLREAPSKDNVKLLLECGADNIYAYDPVGEENFKKLYPTEINYVQTPEEALKDANICFIFTEWGEIKSVKPEEYKKLMKTPLVYDGRNIYDLNEMKDAGIEYYSIGR